MICCLFFFFKQKTAYEMRISDWSSDVCSSDLISEETTQTSTMFGEQLALAVDKLPTANKDLKLLYDQSATEEEEAESEQKELGRASEVARLTEEIRRAHV